MLGHIESYSKDIQTGVIKANGKFFEFYIDVWVSERPPKAGDDVDFLLEDGAVTEVSLVGAYLRDMRPVKIKWVAALLGLFGGCLGFHRFYLGFYSIGVAQILFTGITMVMGMGVGPGVVWGFVEGFLLSSGHFDKDAKGRSLK